MRLFTKLLFLCILTINSDITAHAQVAAPPGGWIDIPASSLPLSFNNAHGSVQIDWTANGVPEVNGTTDAAAFFGWGYAQAVDRFFQMEIARRVMRGTTAELLGAGDGSDKSPPAMDAKSIRMRNYDFAEMSYNKMVADHTAHVALLQAFSDGVNQYLTDRLGPHASWGQDEVLFRQRLTNIDDLFLTNPLHSSRLDLWTPLDTLLAQWRITEDPTLDYSNVLNNSKDYNDLLLAGTSHAKALEKVLGTAVLDEDSMTVQRSDLTTAEFDAIEDYADLHNWPAGASAPYRHYVDPSEPQPKFSHAVGVSGTRSSTGRGILLGMPQIAVSKMWHEISVKGANFTSRGISFAGVPGYMVGFNNEVSWSVTSAGTSTKMLLRLKKLTPIRYEFNGASHLISSTSRRVYIRAPYVSGEPSWTYQNVEVKWAPAVKRAAGGEQTVLQGVPILVQSDFDGGDDPATIPADSHIGLLHYRYFDNSRESLISYIDMLTATSVDELDADLSEYSTPSVTIVATDKNGDARFQFAKPVLLHSSDVAIAPLGILGTQECSVSSDLPSDLVPMEYLPKVKNPTNQTATDIQNGTQSNINGIILLGNNGAVGSWFPIPTYSGLGDSVRSWRLRQMLSAKGPTNTWTPKEILGMNYDDVSPKFLAIVKLARYMATFPGISQPVFTAGARTFLDRFDNPIFNNPATPNLNWVEAGGHLHADEPLMAPLSYLNIPFRKGGNAELTALYGDGDAGEAFFLKGLLNKMRIGRNLFTSQPNPAAGAEVKVYLQRALATAEARLFGKATPNATVNTYLPYPTNHVRWPQRYQERHYNFDNSSNTKTSGAQYTVKFHLEFHPYADLFPGNDIESGVLHNPKYGIGAQAFNAHSQWVHFRWHDPLLPGGDPHAYSITNTGNSQHPTSPFWNNNHDKWRRGGELFDLDAAKAAPKQWLHQAPLQ